jgi:hypothetical protein
MRRSIEPTDQPVDNSRTFEYLCQALQAFEIQTAMITVNSGALDLFIHL